MSDTPSSPTSTNSSEAAANAGRKVMVTGATGYIAGVIVKRLIEAGFAVHAPVRDPNNEKKVAHLVELGKRGPGSIRFFKADLLDEGSYAEAMEGCEIVFHTASPFLLDFKDAQRELIDPALKGTRNVLNSVNATPSVKRVVLTSSCAAVFGDNVDLAATEDGIFTEAHWNTTSSAKHQAYSYSKTVAEREAWKIHDAQDRWSLVAINPSFVLGPGVNPRADSESYALFEQFGDGTMKSGLPDLHIGAVDVRDVAEAHLQAGIRPEASGRYIVSGHNTSFPKMAKLLREPYGDAFPLPKRTLPKPVVWLFGPIINKALTRKMISRNIGHPWVASNDKSKAELGMQYRPLETSTREFFQQLIDAERLQPRR